jgi:hypothetical protein
VRNILLLAALITAGCATSPPTLAFKHRSLVLEKADAVRSLAEANESLKIIRDNSVFPNLKVEDLEVGEFSVVLKGFENVSSNSAGFFHSSNYGSGFVVSSTETKKKREQTGIWYNDIVLVTVSQQQTFEFDGAYPPDEPKATTYNCYLKMRDGSSYTFAGARELPVKRLGSAFSFLSHTKLATSLAYPKFGCIIDEASSCIIGLDVDGVAAHWGIPLYAEIEALDGVRFKNSTQVSKALEEISPGQHVVSIRLSGSLAAKEVTVMVYGTTKLN